MEALLEPLIRNINDVFDGTRARLLWLDDEPPTCTMTYSEIRDGETSAHHIHDWEHEVVILEGEGTLVCDGKEYFVKAGDAMVIPPNVDHYTLNNGGEGVVIRRIEVNPLIAAQSGGAQNDGGQGTGQPPIIRNLSEIDQTDGPARQILGSEHGAINYTLSFRSLDPNSTAPQHSHPGEHVAFMIEGTVSLVVDGSEYNVKEGDLALVPPNAEHEWKSNSSRRAAWLVFNPL